MGWVPHQHSSPLQPPSPATVSAPWLPVPQPLPGPGRTPACACRRLQLPPTHSPSTYPKSTELTLPGASCPSPSPSWRQVEARGTGVAQSFAPVPWAGPDLWVGGGWGPANQPSTCSQILHICDPHCCNSSAALPFPCIWPSWPPGTLPSLPWVTRTSRPSPAPCPRPPPH